MHARARGLSTACWGPPVGLCAKTGTHNQFRKRAEEGGWTLNCLHRKCSKHTQREINSAGSKRVRHEHARKHAGGRDTFWVTSTSLTPRPPQEQVCAVSLDHVTALPATLDWSRAGHLTHASQSELSPEKAAQVGILDAVNPGAWGGLSPWRGGLQRRKKGAEPQREALRVHDPCP